MRVTVLVPAHNEEASLPVTLAALGEQTRPPDRVIVVADNCTDRTVQIAREMGHEAFETQGNVHKKGGALTFVIRRTAVEDANGRPVADLESVLVIPAAEEAAA